MFDLTPKDRAGRTSDFRKEIDDFEKRFFGKPLPTFRTDVKETDSAYVLEAELPGFQREEIRATVQNHLLTISAERDQVKEEQSRPSGYIHRERTRGSFSRSFDITGIRAEQITARFENGLLTVTLPKNESDTDTERELEIRS